MAALKGVGVGAGYFSQFHYDAWKRISGVDIMAICDLDEDKARTVATNFGIPNVYTDFQRMLEAEKPDFVDIITPPTSHTALCQIAGAHGVDIICQKPVAPTRHEAEAMVARAEADGIRLMIHENFRFQPWHREIKKLLDAEAIGDTLHSLSFRSRMGDGWGEDAYQGRQPYFREMPRLLVYETGVHFIDTFRFLAGEITEVYAKLRRLNPVIAGEDCGLLIFTMESGAMAMWDANRYNASADEDPRYTFGTFLVEGNGGSIRLYADGSITIQRLSETEANHPYTHERRGFGGDCCFTTQQHFVDCLTNNKPFETSGKDYLNVLAVQDAVYDSAASGMP
ncbi:MAG: Gfo/Idh/MocA family protein, partial [Rhodothermales bacterium]